MRWFPGRKKKPALTAPRQVALRNLPGIEALDLTLELHPEPAEMVSANLFNFGHWEGVETSFVLKTVKPGQIVIDLGANLGYYTALFSRLVGAAGQVLAFEPDSDNYRLLTSNIIRNGLPNVTATKAVVGANAGIAKLHHHTEDNRGAHMVAVMAPTGQRALVLLI